MEANIVIQAVSINIRYYKGVKMTSDIKITSAISKVWYCPRKNIKLNWIMSLNILTVISKEAGTWKIYNH